MSRFFRKIVKALPIIALPIIHKKVASNGYSQDQQVETSVERLYLSPFDVSLSEFKVFQLGSGELGRQVAAHLDTQLGTLMSDKFADGQCNIQVQDSIRGHNVYVIKRFRPKQINDGVIQLLITVNTLKKQGAANVTCIIPFFPYCQSKDLGTEESKTFFTCFGSDILKMLEQAGCNRVITFNSLMSYPKGFVNECQFMNINAPDLFVGHLATKALNDPVLVSSQINTSNVNNLHLLKEALSVMNFDCPISAFNENDYIGQSVKGRDVILYSNIVRTGNSFVRLSKLLQQMGAKNIYGCAFHTVATESQKNQIISNSYLKELLTTNSLLHQKSTSRFRNTSLARLIAETITLFEQEKPLNQYRIDLEKRKMQFMNHMKKANHKTPKKTTASEIL